MGKFKESVNFLNFQQSNSNWDIAFFNSSLNSKLGFLNECES